MNGYLQIELGGKKQGLKFGNYALLAYSKLNGTAPGQLRKVDDGEDPKAELSETDYLKLITDLVYVGLLNNYYVKRQEADFTMEDVLVWVDDMDLELMGEIVEVFTGSMQTSPSLKKLMDAQELALENNGQEVQTIKKKRAAGSR